MDIAGFTIRKGQLNDLPKLQNLFVGTISTVCAEDYNADQIRVWISSVENKQRWIDIVTNQFLVVAESQDTILGFCSLDGGRYLDFLYVHKDFQGQGIAFKLYSAVEDEARKQQISTITSDVSKTAKPFFEKMGFTTVAEQSVVMQGIKLTNYKMTKELKS
jgi:putative acetyltransferase